jgi:hypothetical protein
MFDELRTMKKERVLHEIENIGENVKRSRLVMGAVAVQVE